MLSLRGLVLISINSKKVASQIIKVEEEVNRLTVLGEDGLICRMCVRSIRTTII